MAWRVTYAKMSRTALSSLDSASRTIRAHNLLKAEDRLELRESDGTIVRLGAGAEFEIKESALGDRPEYYGPVYISRKGGCGKYRTSCWLESASQLSARPDVFMKPGDQPDTDEFFAITGDIIIYEIDEESRTFPICTICEGEKAVISFDSTAGKVRNRYKAQVTEYSNLEYEKILNDFIDSRNWR